MGYVVKMPKRGMNIDQGTIVEWLVEEGEGVTSGQVVAEMVSEKTTGEIEVREDGVLRKRLPGGGRQRRSRRRRRGRGWLRRGHIRAGRRRGRDRQRRRDGRR